MLEAVIEGEMSATWIPTNISVRSTIIMTVYTVLNECPNVVNINFAFNRSVH